MSDRVHPDPQRPSYWRFRDQTRPLIGGSSEDNLFQVPHVEAELDTLRSLGGNYVRCTMSSRDSGDVWPFTRDLYTFNEGYWQRFERFVRATHERDIVMQIELWDRFDLVREPWQHNPLNPKNNDTYTAEQSGLAEAYHLHPAKIDHPFFRTVPELDNNRILLPIQQAFLERLLEITLPFDHVLYCIDNETHVRAEWGAYWARMIQRAARERGVTAYTTEMWDNWNITDPRHDATFLDPDTYPFIDCSQNNQMKGEAHWDNLQARRRQLVELGIERPMNCVKVYGADGGPHGSTQEGVERFWKSLVGGCAAVRFHRPPHGLGLGELAQRHIRAARAVTDEIDVTRCRPANDLLEQRPWNGAYCTAEEGRVYAVCFPVGGSVAIKGHGRLSVTWYELENGGWCEPEITERLTTPTEGFHVAVAKPASA